jgi:uncharacterized protein YjbI with pentapeptide repeats
MCDADGRHRDAAGAHLTPCPRPCDTIPQVSSLKLSTPKVTPPSLDGLEVGDPSAVRSGEDIDGLSLTGADFSDLRLDSVTFQESELIEATMRETHLPGCRFLDVRFTRLDARDVAAPDSTWRDSEIGFSRLGAVSIYGAKVNSLRLTSCKVGYLNMRGSSVADLVIENSTIEDLDLAETALTRASFPGSSIGNLTLRGARLQHVDLRGARLGAVTSVVDLRGATIDHVQLTELAPALAAGLGIHVSP